jgi:hypothetical protein
VEPYFHSITGLKRAHLQRDVARLVERDVLDREVVGRAAEVDRAGVVECDGQLVLIATVHNVGIVDVPSGIDVTFFEGTDNSGSKLVTVPTSEPLFAGGSTDVGFAVIAPPADEPRDYYAEVADGCGDVITDAACPG